MGFRLFVIVFSTIFLAEIGDKTQLATMLYASEPRNSKLLVFVASASALALSSAVGVLAGSVLARYVDPQVISRIAGLGFVAIGIWMILRA